MTVKSNHIRVLAFFPNFLQKIRLRIKIIAVQEKYIFPPSQLCSMIPGPAESPVLLMQHTNPPVPKRQGITKRTAAVCTAVIHQNQLKLPKILPQDALDAFLQIVLDIVYGDNDRKEYLLHNQPFPFHARANLLSA